MSINESNASPAPVEEAFRLAYETLSQSDAGAMVANADGVIVYVNRRLCEITGYSPSELLGKNPKILQSGNTPRETYLALWNNVSSGRAWHGMLENKKKSGELYWEAITISPLKNSEGQITHFSAILEDVTEERLEQSSEQELVEEIFQEEKRECLAAMAFGMGHNLNNSMASILAACNLARNAIDDREKLLSMLGHIESSAKTTANFIEQITSFCKPSLPILVTINLSNILGVHLAHYESVTNRKLHWSHDSEPIPILGNPGLIHETVLALLINAREASGDKSITLSCGALPRLAPDDDEHFLPCGLASLSVAYIEVKDEGEGMDSYTLRRAFNPFFTTKPNHKGLGLAAVYGIMTSHKGAIGITSVPGIGTRVRLYFRIRNEKSILDWTNTNDPQSFELRHLHS